ncbi:hypothetical protein CYMTET_54639 [Cymbomonas tetramitiformis]|uniref:Ammonium transporter n=1 Tax=Cymbomonas tetramitiformis TaxID=36881 RepID=A0AAE0BET7_9CHLO|nr:hypothetical protein CYMTET_54639 [Cymbomonas tetramitiformis]
MILQARQGTMSTTATEAYVNEAISNLTATLTEKDTELEGSIGAIGGLGDVLWLLLGAYMVFFMQAGFALLEAGGVSAKNTKNILLKNILDACLGGMVWWAVGYPFAYGTGGASPNAFIGGANFFMYKGTTSMNDSDGSAPSGYFYAGWMFQWAFAAAAATIVSGAVAERCNFMAYLIYTTIITAFIYPVVVHWGWSSEGWLSAFKAKAGDDSEEEWSYDPYLGGNGFIDFAGSGIVHMTGGGAALMGAIFLGPRTGRFNADGTVSDLHRGHNAVLQALGVFILWFGWYGFNPVSTLAFSMMDIAARVAVTTTLSACAGGCTTLLIHIACGNVPDVGPALNGILAGLVGITAPCVVVEPWAAAFIGFVAAFVYYGSSKMLLKLKIDDVLEASPVHFFCGAWGCLSVGFFATDIYVNNGVNGAYAADKDNGDSGNYGAFYGGGGEQLGTQIVGVLAIAAWTCGTSALMFFGLSKAGVLRVSPEDEQTGLDDSHHGGSAYDMQTMRANTGTVKVEAM